MLTHFPRDLAGGTYKDGRGYLLGPALGLDAARAPDGQEVLVVAADADFRGGPWEPADGGAPSWWPTGR